MRPIFSAMRWILAVAKISPSWILTYPIFCVGESWPNYFGNEVYSHPYRSWWYVLTFCWKCQLTAWSTQVITVKEAWVYPGSSTHGVRILGTIFAKSAGGLGGHFRPPSGVTGAEPRWGSWGQSPWKICDFRQFWICNDAFWYIQYK